MHNGRQRYCGRWKYVFTIQAWHTSIKKCDTNAQHIISAESSPNTHIRCCCFSCGVRWMWCRVFRALHTEPPPRHAASKRLRRANTTQASRHFASEMASKCGRTSAPVRAQIQLKRNKKKDLKTSPCRRRRTAAREQTCLKQQQPPHQIATDTLALRCAT